MTLGLSMMVALRHGPWIYVSDHSFTSVVPAHGQGLKFMLVASGLLHRLQTYVSGPPAYSCGPGFTSMALVLTATGRRSWLWWPQGLRLEAPGLYTTASVKSRCLVWFGVSRSLLLTESVQPGCC